MSSSPQRLHPAILVIKVLTSFRRWFGITSVPWLFVLFRDGISSSRVLLLMAVVAISIVASAVWAVLSWRATVYFVRGNAFHFRQGVIGKNERTVPLDHIQSVDTVQGPVQRLFGIVEVRVETAGGGSNEADVSLAAVARPAARQLQQELAPRRPLAATTDAVEAEAPAPALVRRLSTGRLLLAGATSGQIGVALPIIFTISQLFDDVLTPDFVLAYAQDWLPGSFAGIVVLAAGVLLLAWLVAVAGTVLAYAGFSLSRDGDSLRIKRGLLERREVTIPINRIQAIQVVENVLRQPLGLVLVKMESAGYGADAGVSTTLFPLLRRNEVEDFLQATAPEFAVWPVLQRLPQRARRRYVLRSAFPFLFIALPASALLAWQDRPDLAPLPFILVALGAAYGLLRFRGVGWALSTGRLVISHRTLSHVIVIAPQRRLQSRSMLQTPFQRRSRLATLIVRVGRGSAFEITDLDASVAGEVLYRLGPTGVRATP
jgi:putative membrane protein